MNPRYPDIHYLKAKGQKRVPRFAWEYLTGGCNNEVNLRRNTEKIRELTLKPYYLQPYGNIHSKTTLFGKEYDAPFGICPIGLQGMIWPKATEILAKASVDHNIPFILSTVATASLETVADITEGKAWFQLYNPVEDALRADILKRAEAAGYEVLVLLSDVPSFGYRSKEIKNGLAIPPRMTLSNILQILSHPIWALQTLKAGQPEFKTLKPYLPEGMNLRHLGLFMNKTFSGKLSSEKVKAIRDQWKGKLVMKGVASMEDAREAVRLGIDGLMISNHGGRQLDQGQATIEVLPELLKEFKGKIPLLMDSGIRTGSDIANTLAAGADFTFLGRTFMYGVTALGKEGGNQVIEILLKQLQQIMEQLCCERVEDLPKHLVQPE